ncbi:MAG: MBL fold metallo-hydrolase, partial [Candidatus Bathyarchaeia archaeon]
MLKWEWITKDFMAISVGKEYNGEPYYWTTFYYYKGLVIDAGCPHTAEESAKFMEDMNLNIKAVLLTHHHEDHCGGAPIFKERFGVEVFAPQKSLEILAKPPEIPVYRQVVWGQPKPVKANP